jgi:cysteine desulfurase
MIKKRIYLDYSTTTPVRPEVFSEMERFWARDFGNPSSLHAEGTAAKAALAAVRKSVARILNCKPEEIIFTSGGTESNNLAIFGLVEFLLEERGKDIKYEDLHFITSAIEHSSVLECFEELARRGAKVDYIGVDKEGIVNLKELESRLSPNTVLVSIMYANNEIGTIQPVRKISNLIGNFAEKSRGKSSLDKLGPIFHVDASQAPLYLPVNCDGIGADLVTIDGQKIYGPKGVGLLYVNRHAKIKPIFYGGGQERSLRPGTENIPPIAGLAKALALAAAGREKESARLKKLRDYFFGELGKKFPKAIINGSRTGRLPNNVNFSYPGLDAEFAVLKLDAVGISCSTKSACLERERESYVVKALDRSDDSARTSLRFTLGRTTTKKDIDCVIKSLEKILPAERA